MEELSAKGKGRRVEGGQHTIRRRISEGREVSGTGEKEKLVGPPEGVKKANGFREALRLWETRPLKRGYEAGKGESRVEKKKANPNL